MIYILHFQLIFLLCWGKIWCWFPFQLKGNRSQLWWRIWWLHNCHFYHRQICHWLQNFFVWSLPFCFCIDICTFPLHLLPLLEAKQTQFCSRRLGRCIPFHSNWNLTILIENYFTTENKENFTLNHWIETDCENRLHVKFWGNSFFSAIILDTGSLLISMQNIKIINFFH